MHLHRVTPDSFENYKWEPEGKFLGTVSDDFSVGGVAEDGKPMVRTSFPRFGGGKHRHSDFEVYVEWSDFQRLLEKFCEAEIPEALTLRNALTLAEALKSLGWSARQA